MGKRKDGVSINSRHVGLTFAMPQLIPQMCLRLPILFGVKIYFKRALTCFLFKGWHLHYSFPMKYIQMCIKKTGNPANVTLGLPNAQVSVEQNRPYRTTPPLREVTDPVCNLWELLIVYWRDRSGGFLLCWITGVPVTVWNLGVWLSEEE